jgi:hypothetical protein
VVIDEAARGPAPTLPLPQPFTWDSLLRYAFLCEYETWRRLPQDDHLSPFKTDRPAYPGGVPYWMLWAGPGM